MVKILIIKTSALGDIVHVFPAIQFLKKIYPESEIDWVVETRCASLVQAHPLVNRVISFDTKQWRKQWYSFDTLLKMIELKRHLGQTVYDVVFDFQGNLKSGILTYLTKGASKIGLDIQDVSEWPSTWFTNQKIKLLPHQNIRSDNIALIEAWSGKTCDSWSLTKLRLTLDEIERLKQLRLKKSQHKNIMICPGSHWVNKQLTIETLSAFLQLVEQEFECRFWLISGSLEEYKQCQQLASKLKDACLSEKMSLPLLQHWMGEMDQVITIDSLSLHLAAEAGVPTFACFGPSLASKFKPLGLIHGFFQGNCPYYKQFKKRCPILRSCSTGACLHDINPQEIFCSYQGFLDKVKNDSFTLSE